MKKYRFVFSSNTLANAEIYADRLKCQRVPPGRYVGEVLLDREIQSLSGMDILDALVRSKRTQIFAERDIFGDGSDWNQEELKLLGDIGCYAPCVAFDNGHHHSPVVHSQPIPCGLLFVPGALLRNDRKRTPVDWDTVEKQLVSKERYYSLYENRILPLLLHANALAEEFGKKAVISIPGIGCGNFAGPFKRELGVELQGVLYQLISRYGKRLGHVAAIHYDPFNESRNSEDIIEGIKFVVRPLLSGNEHLSQLSPPHVLAGGFEPSENLCLFSFVAWDHVSWPGNDFYIGNRCTDDGVKAAATDVMTTITGYSGSYNIEDHEYLPDGFYTWGEVVAKKKVELHLIHNSEIYDIKTGVARRA